MKQFSPRWILTVLLTAVLVYLCWQMVQPFITTLLWSIVLTIIAMPIHKRLRKWGHGPTVAALITLLFVIIVVVIPMFFLAKAMVGEAADAIPTMQQGLNDLMKPESRVSQWLAHHPTIKQYVEPANFGDHIKTIGINLSGQAFGLVGNVLLVVAQVGLVLFTTFYMLRDTEGLAAGAKRLLPLSAQQTDEIIKAVMGIISASLKGTVMIAAIQGLMGGITFACLGLPSPLLWGVFMFITSMLPVVGSSIIWGPTAAYLALTGSYPRAIILVVIGAGVIGTVDTLLRPVLVGKRTRMHELVVFFAVLGGLKVFGVLGIIMGPVVVALTMGFVLIFYQMGDEPPANLSVLGLVPPGKTEPAAAGAKGGDAGAGESLAGPTQVSSGAGGHDEHVGDHAKGQPKGDQA